MVVRVTKHPKESFERFMSRFEQAVQRTRLVRILRERRYLGRSLNKRKVRNAALKREFYRAQREKMKYY
ncbi:MAG: hypothetical protein ACD_28C00317G0002 [uncultured bacterium]|nr:MAG: hypothetical protein ACD_28C00317G0002 [uncultured bacterium]